ncbi:hypothetical protein [Halorubellus sp. PRR65]|uniref:hypothetical protein n=1 Tax=Halorubellus sp. PRR65 TaxID=3098148 RepID=UPI002B25EAD2|nr:hypothetical protein [Halorubellus sp. PRR65]
MNRQRYMFGIVFGALLGVFGTGVPVRVIAGVPVHGAIAFVSGVVTIASAVGLLVAQYRYTNASESASASSSR